MPASNVQLLCSVGTGKLPRPKLGLNCVGGTASGAIAKALDKEGCLVTYGGEHVLADVSAVCALIAAFCWLQ